MEGACSMDGGTQITKSEPEFPHAFLYGTCLPIRSRSTSTAENSSVLAAAQKTYRCFFPAGESTLGNTFASYVISGEPMEIRTGRSGIEYMIELTR